MRVLEDIFDRLIENRTDPKRQVQGRGVLFSFEGVDSLAGDAQSLCQIRLRQGELGAQYS